MVHKLKSGRKAPLRWRFQQTTDREIIGMGARGWDYHRGNDILGRVRWSREKKKWYFCCKDGRNSLLAGDGLFANPDEAKSACKEHVKRYLA